MNFRVFVRTLFLVAVLSVVVYTVYANVTNTDRSDRNKPEDGTAINAEITTAENNSGSETSSTSGTSNASATGSDEGENYIKEKVTINITALGDTALGQDSRFNYGDSFDYVFEKIKGDYNYFLSNVVDILSKDDLTIANLETTLSNETEKAEKFDYGNNYWFNGKPEYANILKTGSVEVANLANNHTFDYGQKGYDATVKALNDVGIGHFGYSEVLIREVKGIKIGMVGFNQLGNVEQGLDAASLKQQVSDMTKKLKGEADLVIDNFHWGKEYQYQPTALQKELAHIAVDSGADLVIGNHPHVLQPIEEYKGKYIAYSLGNFLFGGNKKPRDYDTAIYQQAFVFDSDNVLQAVKEPTIVPCSVSSSTGINNYKPAVAVEPQVSRVLEKLNYGITGSEAGNNGDTADKSAMVRLDKVIPDIVIDLKYASSDNIVGKPVYEANVAYLRKGTSDKLNKANQLLMKQGYRIKVWDAYRAQKYQEILYASATNKYYFMDPKIGSVHTRGSAVDITMVDAEGNEVDMPSGFDEQSTKADRTYSKATPEQKQNALILENAMKSCGFIPLQKEWWHFDDTEYKNYPLLKAYSE